MFRDKKTSNVVNPPLSSSESNKDRIDDEIKGDTWAKKAKAKKFGFLSRVSNPAVLVAGRVFMGDVLHILANFLSNKSGKEKWKFAMYDIKVRIVPFVASLAAALFIPGKDPRDGES